MDRLLTLIVVLLLVAVALPTVAGYATRAVPFLVSVIAVLGFVVLLWPSRSRRR